MKARQRTATATSNFGVGARENHDATGVLRALPRPRAVGRRRPSSRPSRSPSRSSTATPGAWTRVADGSVALVVTSPPYFAGKQYEEELEREGVPSSYLEYLEMLTRRVRRVRPQARAGRAHRRQRRQPRPQAVPQPVGRRHPHPRARPRPAAARRADLAEGRGGQRVVRLGLVPQRGQPGAARHHRAGRSSPARAASTGPARSSSAPPRACPTRAR